MKRILEFNWNLPLTVILVTVTVLLDSCQKEDAQAVIKPASDVSSTLTPSTPSVVLDSASASTTTALTLDWNAPDYGVQVSSTYILEIDSMTGAFASPSLVNMGNSMSMAYTKKTLN